MLFVFELRWPFENIIHKFQLGQRISKELSTSAAGITANIILAFLALFLLQLLSRLHIESLNTLLYYFAQIN